MAVFYWILKEQKMEEKSQDRILLWPGDSRLLHIAFTFIHPLNKTVNSALTY
jgi:hypothetical protein